MSETKSALQTEARAAWRRKGSKGTLAAATGVGKTKPAIDEMMELWRRYLSWDGPPSIHQPEAPEIFLAVPTEHLRDVGWPDEVRQWYGDEGMEMWDACVTAVCYISMHKYRSGYYDLVVLDEGHHLTQLNSVFFDNNVAMAILALTATYPDAKTEVFKFYLLNKVAPVCFTYPLEQGVQDGLIADFEIMVVLTTLDDRLKVIPAGTEAKPFMVTEKKGYEYLTKILTAKHIEQNAQVPGVDQGKLQKTIDFMTFKRAQFIYNLPSKTRLAKAVMAAEIKPGLRTLVFCGSIDQCSKLCDRYYHSKTSNLWLTQFLNNEIQTLGCVDALNEGINVPMLDQSIIVQASSSPREMIQQVGRNVRWREGGGLRRIWVLCAQDTQDEKWVQQALASFSPERIKYVSSRSYGL